MYLKQYYLACLAHASYLVADERTRTAIVVDPQRDVDGYIEDARELGFEIAHVFLTHFHADFLAGHLELREKTGARIHLGARARAGYDFVAEADGDRHEWGDLALEILETPGHTPEGISILVYDLADRVDVPKAVLTGDTLFIGDVGRPDLMASVGVSAEELAGMLYDSLREKLMTLPGSTLVYPAHGAGSMCGKNLSSETVSTIGEQMRLNHALQPMSREDFIQLTTVGLPSAPAYFSRAARLNQEERETLDVSLARVRSLPLDDFLGVLGAEKAQIVDSRPSDDFVRNHLKGAINIPLEGRFAVWAGTVLDLDRPVLVVARPGEEDQTAMRLGRIGCDRVLGHLSGPASLSGRDGLTSGWKRLSSAELDRALAMPGGPLVLDVRTTAEWAGSHVPGSLNIPVDSLRARLREIPRDRPVVTMCRSGYRSALAASLLRSLGLDNVSDQRGGIVDWESEVGRFEAGAGA